MKFKEIRRIGNGDVKEKLPTIILPEQAELPEVIDDWTRRAIREANRLPEQAELPRIIREADRLPDQF